MIERTEKLREVRHAVPEAEGKLREAQDALASAERAEKDYRRELVTEKAQEILADEPLVLTLATTGTNADNDRVIEIVLMERDGSVRYRQLLGVDVEISAEATDIHGHTKESLAGEPSFPEIAEAFSDAVGGRRIVAWQGRFERDFIYAECERAGLAFNVVPVPRESRSYEYVRDRELDSIHWLLRDLNDSDIEPHGSKNPTPVGVARTIWGHLEKLASGKFTSGIKKDEEDFDDIVF